MAQLQTRLACAAALSFAFFATAAAEPVLPLPTNIDNFRMRGTQPGGLEFGNEIITSQNQCSGCHGQDSPIYDEWRGSLMSQSARDPVFYACLDIANHDAPGSGDACIRCHVPKAWLEGRSTPTDGSNITRDDRDGITCHFCHRLVDPFDPNFSATPIDELILLGLGNDRPILSLDRGNPPSPGFGGNGNYVIDPFDRRRGPFPLEGNGVPNPPGVSCDGFHRAFTFGSCEDDFGDPDSCPTFESPFHLKSQLCATCHDVSFPHVNYSSGQPVFNGTGVAHPDGNKYNMAAEQRTFSEWLKSSFAQPGGVDMGGRFGADGQNFVSSCQDCHMAAHMTKGCEFVSGERPDIPRHSFNGASSWILEAIALHFGPDGPLEGFPIPDGQGPEFFHETATSLLANADRNRAFVQKSADLECEVVESGNPGEKQLRVRVINQTGHKLPTGYVEGRRMFLTVEYFGCDSDTSTVEVFGGYDKTSGVLDSGTTKVYHAEIGPDPVLAAAAGVTAGPSSHSVLGTVMYYDNRIPPRGFTNAAFAAIQASPVNYNYNDGQYWDDTYFPVPVSAAGVRVTFYYQQTTREYIEFLRDNNPLAGVDPQNRGALAYALWEAVSASPETVAEWGGGKNYAFIEMPGDTNCDGTVSSLDIPTFVDILLGFNMNPYARHRADLDDSGEPDGADIQLMVERMLGG